MPKKCCVSNCRVQQDDPEGLRLSFYKIPADENVKNQWLESIKQHCDIDLKKYSYVCSRHFEKECFDTTCSGFKNGKLKKGCCPTIFVNFKKLKRYGAVHGRKILKNGCLPTLHLTKNDIKKESDNSVDVVQEVSTDSGLSAAHLHTEVDIEYDVKHEPTSESDDEDMKFSKENCSLEKYSRKRKLNPETSPNNSESVYPKTIINPSTNLPLYQFPAPLTISQDLSTHNKLPLNLNEDSFNSNLISPQENSSYFQFFRSIHSDYLMLSAKKKGWFKKQCLNFLFNLLDDDSDNKISTYSQDNVKLSNSGHSEENKNVNPFAEDDPSQ